MRGIEDINTASPGYKATNAMDAIDQRTLNFTLTNHGSITWQAKTITVTGRHEAGGWRGRNGKLSLNAMNSFDQVETLWACNTTMQYNSSNKLIRGRCIHHPSMLRRLVSSVLGILNSDDCHKLSMPIEDQHQLTVAPSSTDNSPAAQCLEYLDTKSNCSCHK